MKKENQKTEEQKKQSTEKEITEELEICRKEKDEYLAGWQRSQADFLNYKKEEAERIGELYKYAGRDLILKILPLLDNFELAELNTPQDLKNSEYMKGILQIKSQLQDILKNQGVEEIKTMGEKFNPNFHEVTEEVEDKGREQGIIVETIKKGYELNGRILRPAKVKVIK